jgi:hypothetical protein
VKRQAQPKLDRAKDRRPDNVGFWYLQHVHQRNHVVRHQIVAVWPRIAGAVAMAAAVHYDHCMVRRQRLYLVTPVVRVCQAAMQQDQRRALAVDRMVDTDPVSVGLAATRGVEPAQAWVAAPPSARRRWRAAQTGRELAADGASTSFSARIPD